MNKTRILLCTTSDDQVSIFQETMSDFLTRNYSHQQCNIHVQLVGAECSVV